MHFIAPDVLIERAARHHVAELLLGAQRVEEGLLEQPEQQRELRVPRASPQLPQLNVVHDRRVVLLL